jgi:hypothetical protein
MLRERLVAKLPEAEQRQLKGRARKEPTRESAAVPVAGGGGDDLVIDAQSNLSVRRYLPACMYIHAYLATRVPDMGFPLHASCASVGVVPDFTVTVLLCLLFLNVRLPFQPCVQTSKLIGHS